MHTVVMLIHSSFHDASKSSMTPGSSLEGKCTRSVPVNSNGSAREGRTAQSMGTFLLKIKKHCYTMNFDVYT